MASWGGKKGHKSRLKLEMSANANWAASGNGSWLPSNHIGKLTETKLFLEAKVSKPLMNWSDQIKLIFLFDSKYATPCQFWMKIVAESNFGCTPHGGVCH